MWKKDKTAKNCKNIESGLPFLFYWVNDEIEIIRHRNDRTPVMGSDEVSLLWFGNGLDFRTDKNKEMAWADYNTWVHPKNTGNLKKSGTDLFFAGGNDRYYKAVDVEVWGLH